MDMVTPQMARILVFFGQISTRFLEQNFLQKDYEIDISSYMVAW